MSHTAASLTKGTPDQGPMEAKAGDTDTAKGMESARIAAHMEAMQPAGPTHLYRCPKCSKLNVRVYKEDNRGSKCACPDCGYKFRMVPVRVG